MLNDTQTTLSLLLSRRSGKARDLIAPGPTAEHITQILSAAARTPDHGKLFPWRFVVVAQNRRTALAEVIEHAYRSEKPDATPQECAAMRAYALDAPCLIVVLSTPTSPSPIPLWEQHLSAGAAIQNALIAGHALGFAGNWLTGWPAYAPAVLHALGGTQGDQVAGFLYFGTPKTPLEERKRPILQDITKHF